MKSIHRRIRTAAVYVASWSIVIAVIVLKWTCRRKIHADPRPLLRANGVTYIYAALHAHQLSALLHGEAGTGSMVSRSLDGQMIVPSLRSMGVHVVRGSGSKHGGGTKGGRAAFEHLYEHVKSGKPGYFSVDGPQGPRGCVHIGVASLAARTGAVVLPIAPIPTRRWIFTRAWDRMQVPYPFCTIDGYFGPPLQIHEGESTENFRKRIEQCLAELERKHDPNEGRFATSLRNARAA